MAGPIERPTPMEISSKPMTDMAYSSKLSTVRAKDAVAAKHVETAAHMRKRKQKKIYCAMLSK